MVKPAMVGRMVHGNAANDILKLFHVKHFLQPKICIYQIKVVPLHTVFIFELDLW